MVRGGVSFPLKSTQYGTRFHRSKREEEQDFGMTCPALIFLRQFWDGPEVFLPVFVWTGPNTDTYILQDFGMVPKIEEQGQVFAGTRQAPQYGTSEHVLRGPVRILVIQFSSVL